MRTTESWFEYFEDPLVYCRHPAAVPENLAGDLAEVDFPTVGKSKHARDPKRKRRPLIFRERDVTRAIAGHLKAGLSVARVEIDASGRIVVVTGDAEPSGVVPHNEWDDDVR